MSSAEHLPLRAELGRLEDLVLTAAVGSRVSSTSVCMADILEKYWHSSYVRQSRYTSSMSEVEVARRGSINNSWLIRCLTAIQRHRYTE